MTTREQLAVLRTLESGLYEPHRDALVAMRDDPKLGALLALDADHADWPRAMTARVVQGWQQHGGLYRSVLDELDGVDVDQVLATATGMPSVWDEFRRRAVEDYREGILPLCWERVVKYGRLAPSWKTTVFARMMEAVPHERNVPPLLHCLSHSDDYSVQDECAQALRAQPPEVMQPEAERLYRKHDVVAGLLQRLASRPA